MISSILDKCLLAIELLEWKFGSIEGGLETTNSFMSSVIATVVLMQSSIDDTANASIIILCRLLALELNHDKNLKVRKPKNKMATVLIKRIRISRKELYCENNNISTMIAAK